MSAIRRTGFLPTMVVEGAAIDSHELRRLVDGEERGIAVVTHECFSRYAWRSKHAASRSSWEVTVRGDRKLLPLSKQISIPAVAKRKAALEITSEPNLEPFARPIPFNALATIDDSGYLAERGPSAPAIEGYQCIAQPLRLSSPTRHGDGRGAWRGQQALELRELSGAAGNIAESLKLERECHWRDRDLRARDGQLECAFRGAQDHVLATDRVEKNMLDIGQSGQPKPCTAG